MSYNALAFKESTGLVKLTSFGDFFGPFPHVIIVLNVYPVSSKYNVYQYSRGFEIYLLEKRPLHKIEKYVIL